MHQSHIPNFVTEMCTVTKRCIVRYFLMHCGICEMGLWNYCWDVNQYMCIYMYVFVHKKRYQQLIIPLLCIYNIYMYSETFIIMISAWSQSTRHIDGLVEDCDNSIALAMELPQSYSKPSLWENYKGLESISKIISKAWCTRLVSPVP